jgi:hypothetical protein
VTHLLTTSRLSATTGGRSAQDDTSAAVARLRAQFALPFTAAPSAAAAAPAAAPARQGGAAGAAPPCEQGREAGPGPNAQAGASGAAAASGAASACQGGCGGGEEPLGNAEAGQPEGLDSGTDARPVQGDMGPGSRTPAERTRTAAAARQHEGALGGLAPDQNPFAPLLRTGNGAAAAAGAGAGPYESNGGVRRRMLGSRRVQLCACPRRCAGRGGLCEDRRCGCCYPIHIYPIPYACAASL